MKKFVPLAFLIFTLACDTERNIPSTKDFFVKFYGGEGNQTGIDFVLTPDDHLVMVGNSVRVGKTQMIYVVKVTLDGDLVWENYIGDGTKNNTVKDVELHPDGRVVIAGETEMAPGNRDIFVKTLSQDGNELDSIHYGLNRLRTGDEEVFSISIITAGTTFPAGYIVAGSTTDVVAPVPPPSDSKDGMHIRFTDNPLAVLTDPVWNKSTGLNNSEDVVVKVYRVATNELYGFGYTNTISPSLATDFKYWIFKTPDNGSAASNSDALYDLLGATNEDEKLTTAILVDSPVLSEQGFVLGGVATKANGNSQAYLVKLKANLQFLPGDISWQGYPISMGSNANQQVRVFYNRDSETYFALATNKSGQSEGEISLTKLSQDLTPIWTVPLSFGGNAQDEAGSVIGLPSGKILVLGTMKLGGLNGQQKMALLKLNANGILSN
ncbi:MAG: hypothetical protein J0L66_02660 [Cytophagales bacterium]|nr:hypothetical protein [Cytophagales bacterium]